MFYMKKIRLIATIVPLSAMLMACSSSPVPAKYKDKFESYLGKRIGSTETIKYSPTDNSVLTWNYVSDSDIRGLEYSIKLDYTLHLNSSAIRISANSSDTFKFLEVNPDSIGSESFTVDASYDVYTDGKFYGSYPKTYVVESYRYYAPLFCEKDNTRPTGLGNKLAPVAKTSTDGYEASYSWKHDATQKTTITRSLSYSSMCLTQRKVVREDNDVLHIHEVLKDYTFYYYFDSNPRLILENGTTYYVGKDIPTMSTDSMDDKDFIAATKRVNEMFKRFGDDEFVKQLNY